MGLPRRSPRSAPRARSARPSRAAAAAAGRPGAGSCAAARPVCRRVEGGCRRLERQRDWVKCIGGDAPACSAQRVRTSPATPDADRARVSGTISHFTVSKVTPSTPASRAAIPMRMDRCYRLGGGQLLRPRRTQPRKLEPRRPDRPRRALRRTSRPDAAPGRCRLPPGDTETRAWVAADRGYTLQRMPCLPVVAIVGRPNVGKSTLFNRLVGERVAIVEDMPGTTRDRVYGIADWNGRELHLVDTGGLELEPGEPTSRSGCRTRRAWPSRRPMSILFVVDAAAGIAPLDHEVADRLRAPAKPVDPRRQQGRQPAARARGRRVLRAGLRPDRSPISAQHGRNTGDLADEIVDRLPPADSDRSRRPEEMTDEDLAELAETEMGPPRVAIVGRPEHRQVDASSTGSSGEERMIVSRGARHHARPDRHRGRAGWRADDPHRHRRHPPARARSSAGSSATPCCAR